ncbi:NADH-quinone oxidoreductase subunit N [Methanohalobium sp.]|uniref:NADH-quinone oxidoreductase subunit N n=1 Tax=Methanohalobium sp. TaxID=2837493 RepID=UPI0025E6C6BD|nr:NADH-quinone oxidoreductase subunit N [Methanohalobium sp.]
MNGITLFAPELTVVATALVVLLIGLFLNTESKKVLGYLASAGLFASLVLTLMNLDANAVMYSGTLTVDALSQFFKIVFLIVALLVSVASIKYTENNEHVEEYFTLVLLAVVGMMMVASSNDLLVLFISFELASISTYALAGFERRNLKSLESAMKYFIIGALSSALMLFGISFVYGLAGTTNIPEIAQNSAMLVSSPLGIVSIVLLVAGFGFKIALVPFHMWAPDTYEGSPSVVSSLLAAGSKKMGFVAAFKVFMIALVALKTELTMAFAILSVITMTLGNVIALSQNSVKRMLAYSSVAQAGYISMAFVVMSPMAITGGLFYILSHGFMKAGAFLVTAVVGYMILSENREAENVDHLENFKGLAKRMPISAFSMMIFVFALAGIPLTAGYMSKFVLFSSTIEAGLVWLAVIAILNSAISLYYYARVVKYMYFYPAEGERVSEPLPYALTLIAAVVGVLILGFWPEPFIQWAMEAANVLIAT